MTPRGEGRKGSAGTRHSTYIVVDVGGITTQADATVETLGDRYETVWVTGGMEAFADGDAVKVGRGPWTGERIEVTIRNLGTAAAPGHRENGTLRRATEAARAVVTVPSAWRSRVDTERSGGKVLLDDGGDLILAVGTDIDWDVEPLRRALRAWREGRSSATAEEAGARRGGSNGRELPDWIRFWDVRRYDGDMRQGGWGRGKDDRAGGRARKG